MDEKEVAMAAKETLKAPAEERGKEPYREPLLLKHDPLVDVTGQKSGEKIVLVKTEEIEKKSIAEG
jgi:hypothetical protein